MEILIFYKGENAVNKEIIIGKSQTNRKIQRIREDFYRYTFTILAFASLLFLVGICLTLLKEALPIIKEVNIINLIFGKDWDPTYEPATFGMLPLIMSSFMVTFGALLVGVPLGIGSALYINELAGKNQKFYLKPMIEILASVPSIVYGFFGIVVVAPFIQKTLNLPIGLCAFTASLILGIMVIPTICSITEDALSYVPVSLKEASLSLGATRWQTLLKVMLPSAGSGISTSIVLGMGRVVGETMTVLMVAGGAKMMPSSFFDPVRPMTATIAAEMGEAVIGSLHYNALFTLGLILFIITFIINIIAEMISRRFRLKLGSGR